MARDISTNSTESLSFNIKQKKIIVIHKFKIDPGPGSYRSPSDFGHYDGDVYNYTGGISYMVPKSMRSSRKRFWELYNFIKLFLSIFSKL